MIRARFSGNISETAVGRLPATPGEILIGVPAASAVALLLGVMGLLVPLAHRTH